MKRTKICKQIIYILFTLGCWYQRGRTHIKALYKHQLYFGLLLLCGLFAFIPPLHAKAQVVVPNVYYHDVSISKSTKSFTLPSGIPEDANIVGVYWSYLAAGGDTRYKAWVGEGQAYVSISGRTVSYYYSGGNTATDWVKGKIAVVWTNAGDSVLQYSTGTLSINGKYDSGTRVVYGSQSTNKLAFMYSGSKVPGSSPKGGGENCSASLSMSVGSSWVQLRYNSSNARKHSGSATAIVFYAPTQPTVSINYDKAWTKDDIPVTFAKYYNGTGISDDLNWIAFLGDDPDADPVWEGAGISELTKTITENGIYYLKIRDDTLNEYAQSFTVSNIDRTPPNATITPSITDISINPITLTCTASDTQSGLHTSAYCWMNSTMYTDYINGDYTPIWSTLNTFKASVDDTYYCLVRDAVGNISASSYDLKVITLTIDFSGGEFNGNTSSKMLLGGICDSKNTHTFDITQYYGTLAGTSYNSKGLNNNLTKTDSNDVQYRFLGYSLNPDATVPDSQFDVYAKDTRTENYAISEKTILYAVWEPVLQMTVQVTAPSHAETIVLTDDISVNTAIGNFTIFSGTRNTDLSNSVTASVNSATIGATVTNEDLVTYTVSAKGNTEIKFSTAADSRILDIYNHGKNNPWFDKLNEVTDFNYKITDFSSVTRSFTIPRYLGTTQSYQTSNPNSSSGTAVYGIKFTCTQSSYYYNKYWYTDESTSIYCILFLDVT